MSDRFGSLALRCPTMMELPSADSMADVCDWAIEHSEPLFAGPLLLVPDVLVVEWMANGRELPDTVRTGRGDGRSVSVFVVLEDGQGYGVRPTDGPA